MLHPESSSNVDLIGAIDQGTSSSRFLLFNSETAEVVAVSQEETNQILPQEGWVEQDPMELLRTTERCIESAVLDIQSKGYNRDNIKAVGITTQGVSTILWDKNTGRPLHNVITWQDTRTANIVENFISMTPNKSKDDLRPECGLPINSCFSAVKLRWLIDHSQDVRDAITDGRCLFGTVDSWLLWNLTGGTAGGVHATDVTMAGVTMLMNIETLQWDEKLCSFFRIPLTILPEIKSSSELFGHFKEGCLQGVPICGILMDQCASLLGHGCVQKGNAKTTYGTGAFVMFHTGSKPVLSHTGMCTMVANQLGPEQPPEYCLMGAVQVAGSCVRWLKDNLGIINSSKEVESLAREVDSTHGVHFVPAFSGLFGTSWDTTARGIICGLSQFSTKQHIARAALEAVCFQIKEVLEAIKDDSGLSEKGRMRVDGGMTENDLLMQLQADILQDVIERPSMHEETALGAAIAAGLVVGKDMRLAVKDKVTMDVFNPSIPEADSSRRYARWLKAVERSLHWENEDIS